MKALSWIPFGLVVGFLVGYGVPVGFDLLPLLAITFLAVGLFLISSGGVLQE